MLSFAANPINAVCKIDYLCVSSRSLANIVPYIYVLAISVQDLQVMLLYEFEEAQVLSANGDLLLSLSFSKLFVLKTRKVIFYMPKGKYTGIYTTQECQSILYNNTTRASK